MPPQQSSQLQPSRAHIPALDGIRGFAAIMVFLLHYGGGAHAQLLPVRLIGYTIRLGWSGVSLFFVLSGFLITGILWDSMRAIGWWRNFYMRRSLRIFPLYYFALAISFTGALFFHRNAVHLWPVEVINWTYVFYLQNIPPLHHWATQIPSPFGLGHTWSLAVEEQFYLLWPFLLLFVRKSRAAAVRLCIAVWLASLAFRILVVILPLQPQWGIETLPGRAGDMAAGAALVLAAGLGPRVQAAIARFAPWVIVVSLGAVAGAVLYCRDPLQQNPSSMGMVEVTFFSLLYASLIAICLRPGALTAVFQWKPLRWFGKISYGFYVYHLLLRPIYIALAFRIAPEAGRNAHLLILFFVALVGTLAAASLSFYTFERAFLRLKDRYPTVRPQVRA
ncbi:MAG: acyltransferase [Acidobacteria bacterium]|nr:acyltransferase [Acidobacteriota bacterium]